MAGGKAGGVLSFPEAVSLRVPVRGGRMQSVSTNSPNGLSEVGTLLSAVSRDQPGHLESWADPPTQLEPRGAGEGYHASERRRRIARKTKSHSSHLHGMA